MSDAPRAIVAGHADFAAGIVSAVERITGRGSRFEAVTAGGLDTQGIESLIRDRMLETGARVLFTDLQAGSCTMAARRVLRGMPDAVLVCGTNLPMLLEFAFADDQSPADAARRAIDRAHASITILEGTA